MGFSRGRCGARINAAVDDRGYSVELVLTPGQAANLTQAETIIEGTPIEVVMADRGYGSQEVVGGIEAEGGEAEIPT